MISGAFAIISQSLSLGCFPRVKVVHTSAKYEGQVYIPEVNYMLMVACVVVCFAFKTTVNIGNAYGKQLDASEFVDLNTWVEEFTFTAGLGTNDYEIKYPDETL